MKNLKTTGLVFVLIFGIASIFGSGRPGETPSTQSTRFIEPRLIYIPDQFLPGCISELVEQTLTLPQQEVTPNVDGQFNRVNVVVPTGAVYNFSIRPVNPLNCSSTSLPSTPNSAISFGFNYFGEFSEENPVCMSASKIELLDFQLTGTLFDPVIELLVHGVMWVEADRSVARMLNGGTLPENADPRCSGWVDFVML